VEKGFNKHVDLVGNVIRHRKGLIIQNYDHSKNYLAKSTKIELKLLYFLLGYI
jgi:hypothetical protein